MSCAKHLLCCAFSSYPACFLIQKPHRESVSTKIMYFLLLFMIGGLFVSLTFLRNFDIGKVMRIDYITIYQIGYAIFLFHIILAIFLVKTRSSLSVRGKIHRGFWFWKFSVLVGLWNLIYFTRAIKRQSDIFVYFAISISLIFLLLQSYSLMALCLKIDRLIASIKFVKKVPFRILYSIIVVGVYLISLSFYGYQIYRYFGLLQFCSLWIIIFISNFLLTLWIIIFALISPKTREQQVYLTSSFLAFYLALLTYHAIDRQPTYVNSDNIIYVISNTLVNNTFFESSGLLTIIKSKNYRQTIARGYNATIREHLNICLLAKKENTNHIELLVLVFSLTSVLITTMYSTYTSSSNAKHLQIRSFRENLEDQINSSLTVQNLINENQSKDKTLWSHVNHSNNWNKMRRSLRSRDDQKMVEKKNKKITRYKTIGFHSGLEFVNNVKSKLSYQQGDYIHSNGSCSLPNLHQIAQIPDKRKSHLMSLISEPFSKNSAIVRSPPTEETSNNVRFMSQVDIRQITLNAKKKRKRLHLPWIVGEKQLNPVEEELLAKHLSGLFEDDLMMPDISYQNERVANLLAGESSPLNNRIIIENTPRKSMKLTQLKRNLVQHRMRRNMTNRVSNESIFNPNDQLVQRAREASEILGRGIDKRLVVRRPDFEKSLESLQLMLGNNPRDEFIVYNESIAATYSYSYFHFIYGLSYIYFMCKVTNWYDPESVDAHKIHKSWANVFSDLIHAWLLFCVYIFMTLCPGCPKNKFLSV